jgi:hypothetical protein
MEEWTFKPPAPLTDTADCSLDDLPDKETSKWLTIYRPLNPLSDPELTDPESDILSGSHLSISFSLLSLSLSANSSFVTA